MRVINKIIFLPMSQKWKQNTYMPQIEEKKLKCTLLPLGFVYILINFIKKNSCNWGWDNPRRNVWKIVENLLSWLNRKPKQVKISNSSLIRSNILFNWLNKFSVIFKKFQAYVLETYEKKFSISSTNILTNSNYKRAL